MTPRQTHILATLDFVRTELGDYDHSIIGALAEIWAIESFGLTKMPRGNPRFDARDAKGNRIQIKGTLAPTGGEVRVAQDGFDILMVFRMHGPEPVLIYNQRPPDEMLDRLIPDKNGEAPLQLDALEKHARGEDWYNAAYQAHDTRNGRSRWPTRDLFES
jgi:hypothetical protein